MSRVFNELLEELIESNKLEIRYPYGDSYFELYKDGEKVCGMNPKGHNLLFNAGELMDQLKKGLHIC